MEPSEAVTIEVAFCEPPNDGLSPGTIRGGISVAVDGTELTSVARESDEPAEWYDAEGARFTVTDRQFHGEYLLQTIHQLLGAVRTVHDADGRHDEQLAEVPFGNTLVVSHLDGEAVRLAFQEKHPNNPRHPVPLEVALGVAVDRLALTRAAVDAADSYLEYASRCYDLSGSDAHDDLLADLAELRDRVEASSTDG